MVHHGNPDAAAQLVVVGYGKPGRCWAVPATYTAGTADCIPQLAE